ncbi:hypothetical protein BpHYR1_003709 [Brachionus plicatilis]|uniref:Uncharacterized protein n=1 Tax=Brachionus plicatilis TaxID=10195 RepID=A0A3M7PPI6_BRAPC|nr:hypothetical protein BpHYR1_003709 [Brachionus plicatilis]
MIPFTNWREDNDESQAILKRSEEIKNLIDNVHPEAAKNIKLKQIKQKIIHDNDNNVTDERIPISSTVLIKCEGLLTKLEPRFKGPYKVNDYTKRGNYVLSNSLGEVLKDSFPRHKLKIGPQNTSLQAFGENCSIDKLPTIQKNESTNRSKKEDLLTQEQYQKNLNIKGPQNTSLQAFGENCSIDKLPTIQKNESTNRSKKEDLLIQEQNYDLALSEKNLFDIDQHSFNIDLNFNEEYLRNLSFLDI